jgi:hypothetical protein
MDKINQVAGAQYDELKDNLGEIEAYYTQYKEQGESCRPVPLVDE